MNKIVKFIRENSKSLGYYIIYEYERKYIKENKHYKNGEIKTCVCRVKKFIKNGVIE